ncbi:MAG: T9SS type A sorting domain-containing protein, partial [Cyclobacteriaceae bacterium]|nr:T9SS type A sorting domain-containing protein [Cyclobacteriaceae bacterium]
LNLQDTPVGNYTLNFSDIQTLTTGFDIRLIDNFSVIETIISDGSSYSFDVTADPASTGSNRFQLVLAESVINKTLNYTIDSQCTGTDYVTVTIDNSQQGITYSLYDAANKVSGDFIGNNGPLDIVVSKTLLKIGANILSVQVDNATCSSTFIPDALTIDIHQIYEVTSVTNGQNCGLGSVTLQATGAPADGFYRWYESADATVPVSGENGEIFLTPELQATKWYYVSVVNGQGCESATRQKVVAEILDVSGLNAPLTYSVDAACNADGLVSVTIDKTFADIAYSLYNGNVAAANELPGNGGALTFTLDRSTLLAGSNLLDVRATSATCGVVNHPQDLSISINPVVEVASVNAGTTLCDPGTMTLTATGAPELGSYKWYESNDAAEPIVGAVDAEFITPELTASTSYFVSVVNAQGCESIERKEVFVEVVDLKPAIDSVTISPKQEYILTSNYAEGNQWFKGGQLIEGATGQTLEVKEIGEFNYHVEVSLNGCTKSSEELPLLVLGVNDLAIAGYKTYPNPVGDYFNLEYNGFGTKNVHVTIYNVNGRIMLDENIDISGEKHIFETKRWRKGLYLLRLADGNTILLKKFIKN